MDFAPKASVENARIELRDFLDKFLTAEVLAGVHESGTEHDWAFHRALAAEGWLNAPLPVSDGGRGYGSSEMFAVLEAMSAARAPVDGWIVTMNVLVTLKAHADQSLSDEVERLVRAGDAIVSLGLSEPGAGSDVAAITTQANRCADGRWTINGQKIFTTLAHEARWVFLLTRTNPDVSKHRGLTIFLVPMDSDGIEIRPVDTLGGERTNMTFYTDVRIDDRYRVGEVDGGWSVLMSLLALERGGEFGGMSLFAGTLARALNLWSEWSTTSLPGNPDARGSVDTSLSRVHLGRALAKQRAAQLLSQKSISVAANGGAAVVEAAMAKLYTAELLQRAARDLLNTIGAEGLLMQGAANAPAEGKVEELYRHAAVVTIYGGTSEVMRTVIAKQGLRLPSS